MAASQGQGCQKFWKRWAQIAGCALANNWSLTPITFTITFTALAELSTRQIAETMDATGLPENTAAAKAGGGIAKQARKQLDSQTGKLVVSRQNYLALRAAKGLVKPSLRKP